MRIGRPRSAPAQLAHARLHDHTTRPIPDAVLHLPAALRADACRIRSAAPSARIEPPGLRLGFGVAVRALARVLFGDLSANPLQERAATVSGRASRPA